MKQRLRITYKQSVVICLLGTYWIKYRRYNTARFMGLRKMSRRQRDEQFFFLELL